MRPRRIDVSTESVGKSEASSITCWNSHVSSSQYRDAAENCMRFASSNRVFGRSKELQVLHDTFDRKNDSGTPNVVVVQGMSGSGKTALVESMRSTVTENGDCFSQGKFDQYSNTVPFSALASCFSDIVDFAVQGSNGQVYRDSLLKEFGDNEADLNIMSQLVTNLHYLIPTLSAAANDDENQSTKGTVGVAKLRSRVLFRQLLNAMRIPEDDTRILFFMDDIQWGDPSELQLLESLMRDKEMKHVTFVIAYREGECDWKMDESIPHHNILLDNLDMNSISEFLAEMFQRGGTDDLAKIILNKTGGNPYFMNEFIDLLLEDQLIEWTETNDDGCDDESKHQWVWDTDKIRHGTNISKNVLEVVTVKIERLENDLQELLKLASCMGFYFDRELFFKVYSLERNGSVKTDCIDEENSMKRMKFDSLVDEATDQGLLEKSSPTIVKHAHDKIQECVYSMVENRKEVHIRIGRLLCEQDDKIAFLQGVHQLNRGIPPGKSTPSSHEQLEMAKLNLKASKLSMSMSSFSDAAAFLQLGTSFFKSGGSWESEPELALSMYCAMAEVACSRGDHELCKSAAKEVMQHVNTFDSLQAVFALLQSMVMANEVEAASKLCTTTLKKLGYRFPEEPSLLTVGYLLVRVKASLKRYSDEELLLLPAMQDEKIFAKIKLLLIVCEYAFIARNSNVFSTGVLMLVQITLTRGSSEASPFIFAAYSMLLSYLEKSRESFRFGQLALKYQDKFPNDPFCARTLTYIGMFSSHWRQTFHDVLSQCSQAYSIGLQRGETIAAMQAANGVISAILASGKSLSILRDQGEKLVNHMREFNQVTYLPTPLFLTQLAINLMGDAEFETILSGEMVDEAEALDEYERTGNLLGTNIVMSIRVMLFVFLSKWQDARKAIKAMESGQRAEKGVFVISQRVFNKALVNLIVYKETGKKKYLRVANLTLRRMERWLDDGMTNVETYVLIVKAELVSLKGENDRTRHAFNEAIESARRAEYVHLEALANERAARNLVRNNAGFKNYMEAAMECYIQWEAFVKEEHIRPLLQTKFSGLWDQLRENR